MKVVLEAMEKPARQTGARLRLDQDDRSFHVVAGNPE